MTLKVMGLSYCLLDNVVGVLTTLQYQYQCCHELVVDLEIDLEKYNPLDYDMFFFNVSTL
jgi:hypothetical protein